MSGQYGVKESKEVLDLGFAVGQALKNAKADGKVDVADLVYLLPAIQVAGPAMSNLALVPKELGELDAADAAELMSHASVKVAGLVDDEHKKKVVNAALKVGLAVAELVSVL